MRRFNARYGYHRGDPAIAFIGALLRYRAQENDVYRVRGDEFVITIADEAQAAVLAERFRTDVEAVLGGPPDELTISAGVAYANPNSTLQSLLTDAFDACKEAKSKGKNTVCFAPK